MGWDTTTGDWTVSQSIGTEFQQSIWGNWSTSTSWVNVLTGDYDGDGDADIAGQDPSDSQWQVAISSGSDFTNDSWGISLAGGTNLTVADVDRDGRDDIVGKISGNWLVAMPEPAPTSNFDERNFGTDYFVETTVSANGSSVEVVDYHYRLDWTIDHFESVRNSVQFDPSRGPMKGPLATEQTRLGNAWDQSGLLLDYLQASEYDVESRLAVGTATADADDVIEWLGIPWSVTSTSTAVVILQRAGLSGVTQGTDEISFSHAWVEVKVAGEDGLVWQALDPSWKFRSYQDGVTGLITSVGFDDVAYLDDDDAKLPWSTLRTRFRRT